MQKKLIALAVAGLVSGGAFAQSNVTLYGVADVGVTAENIGFGNKFKIQSGQAAGSRIGFKGEEALGNGMKAMFLYEMGIQVDQGVTGSGSGTAQGANQSNTSSAMAGPTAGPLTFGRQAWAGLSTQMGDVTFGRQYSTMLTTYAKSDAFNLGFGGTYFATAANLPGYSTRINNTVKYMSPNFSGFQIGAMYGSGSENNVNGNDVAQGFSDKGGRYEGLLLSYANGPLDVGLSYHDLNANTALTPAVTSPVGNKAWTLGGSYDFKVAKLFLNYANGKQNNTGAAAAVNRNSYNIAGSIPVMGKDTILVGWSKLRDKTPGVTNADFKVLGIAYKHPLSKRTEVYAGYAKGTNDSAALYGLCGSQEVCAVLPAGQAGYDPSKWDFGITHSF